MRPNSFIKFFVTTANFQRNFRPCRSSVLQNRPIPRSGKQIITICQILILNFLTQWRKIHHFSARNRLPNRLSPRYKHLVKQHPHKNQNNRQEHSPPAISSICHHFRFHFYLHRTFPKLYHTLLKNNILSFLISTQTYFIILKLNFQQKYTNYPTSHTPDKHIYHFRSETSLIRTSDISTSYVANPDNYPFSSPQTPHRIVRYI